MIKDTKQRIGFLLQQARKQKKMTQADIAEACGMSVEAVSNIERGVNYPSFDNFFLICEKLDCSSGEILSDVVSNDKKEPRLSLETKAIAVIRHLPDQDLKIVSKMLSALKS